MQNWTCKRKGGFLGIFCNAQSFSVCRTVQWICQLWNSLCVSTNSAPWLPTGNFVMKTESELICNTDSDEYVEDSESDETEDDDDDEQPSSVMQRQQVMKWGLRSQVNQTHVHRCTGSDREKQNEAPHINKESSPLSIFMLYFASVIDLLVTD